MIMSASQMRAALAGAVAVLRPVLSFGEAQSVAVALQAIPSSGVARARHLRAFLRVLSGCWLFQASRRTNPLGGPALERALNITAPDHAWVTDKTLDAVAAYLAQSVAPGSYRIPVVL